MKYLDKSIKINKLDIKNRLVFPPMATSKSIDGWVNDDLVSYYDEKSKSGKIGLIITEHAYVSMDGKASENQVSISRDEDVEGLSRIVDVIHKNGSRVFAQINHAGNAAKTEITGCDVVSASALEMDVRGTKRQASIEMTKEDIDKLIQSFVGSGIRAKSAGYDGVEIHSAHFYLLNQFYSPLSNKRSDEYGGSLENRIRIHLEIIKAMRQALGQDYPLALRLGACDYTDGGNNLEDAIRASKAFEEAGIDLLDISGGYYIFNNPYSTGEGYFKDVTYAIKSNVSIPVILTGGIHSVDTADYLIENKYADMIGVGRPIFKDSSWPETNMK